LKKRILSLGAMVEERVRFTIKAMETRDGDLAKKVVELDHDIDEREVEIEEECLKILALHQPVAEDLRFLAAIIKINNDLERIGDEAANIAEAVAKIAKRPPLTVPIDFSVMAEKAEAMLKGSLDALVNLDVDLAYKICLLDDEVDDMYRDVYRKIEDAIPPNPERVRSLINLLLISRHLERIADHATNIAEDVIYMLEGQILRHQSADYKPDHPFTDEQPPPD
jgi:phosphate transport system protein